MKPIRFRRWLVILTVAFAATRVGLLYFSSGLEIDEEVQTRGVLAIHLDRGLLMPFYLYQDQEFAGGSMIVGLLAWLPFTLFGPSDFALRLVAAGFATVLFALSVAIAYRWFGLAAALAVAAVSTFAPQGHIGGSLLGGGNHSEVTVFYALALILLATMREKQGRPASWAAAAGMGATLGFAVYFSYETLILVPVLAAVCVLTARRRRTAAAECGVAACGFAVGFLPWIAVHGVKAPSSYFASFYRTAWQAGERTASFNDPQTFVRALTTNLVTWTESFPLAIGGFAIPGWVFDAVLFAAFAFSYGFLAYSVRHELADLIPLRRRRGAAWTPRHLLIPILAYVPLHLIAYALYRHQGPQPIPPHRYLNALFFFDFLIIGIAAGRLWDAGARRVAAGMLAAVVAASLAGDAKVLAEFNPGFLARTPGYSYRFFLPSMVLGHHFSYVEDETWEYAARTYPGREQAFLAGVAAGIGFMDGRSIDGHLAAARSEGPEALRAFSTGLGVATALVISPRPERAGALAALVDPALADAFAAGEADGPGLRWDGDG